MTSDFKISSKNLNHYKWTQEFQKLYLERDDYNLGVYNFIYMALSFLLLWQNIHNIKSTTLTDFKYRVHSLSTLA